MLEQWRVRPSCALRRLCCSDNLSNHSNTRGCTRDDGFRLRL